VSAVLLRQSYTYTRFTLIYPGSWAGDDQIHAFTQLRLSTSVDDHTSTHVRTNGRHGKRRKEWCSRRWTVTERLAERTFSAKQQLPYGRLVASNSVEAGFHHRHHPSSRSKNSYPFDPSSSSPVCSMSIMDDPLHDNLQSLQYSSYHTHAHTHVDKPNKRTHSSLLTQSMRPCRKRSRDPSATTRRSWARFAAHKRE